MISQLIVTTLQSILAALTAGLPTTPTASAAWSPSTITLSTSAVAVGGAGPYNGGVLLTNLDSSITVYISTTALGCASAATRYALIPGISPSIVIPFASAAGIFAQAASGAPLLGVVAAS